MMITPLADAENAVRGGIMSRKKVVIGGKYLAGYGGDREVAGRFEAGPGGG